MLIRTALNIVLVGAIIVRHETAPTGLRSGRSKTIRGEHVKRDTSLAAAIYDRRIQQQNTISRRGCVISTRKTLW